MKIISDYDLYMMFECLETEGVEGALNMEGEEILSSVMSEISEKYKFKFKEAIEKFTKLVWSDNIMWPGFIKMNNKQLKKLKLPENITEKDKEIVFLYMKMYKALQKDYGIFV